MRVEVEKLTRAAHLSGGVWVAAPVEGRVGYQRTNR